jgi:hypothetical protein
VIGEETADRKVEVSAMDPIASIQAISNPELRGLADEEQGKLRKVVDQL